ncbi:MAG: hypothetical protein AB8E87_07010 [Prochlorococcus sp.]
MGTGNWAVLPDPLQGPLELSRGHGSGISLAFLVFLASEHHRNPQDLETHEEETSYRKTHVPAVEVVHQGECGEKVAFSSLEPIPPVIASPGHQWKPPLV